MLFRNALAVASGSLASRYILGDTFTQFVLEGRDSQDMRRTFLFASFGAVMGIPAYMFFAEFPQRILIPRVSSKMKLIVSMICCDAVVFVPLVYLPTFYLFREAIYSQPSSLGALLASSHGYWKIHVKEDLIAASPLLVSTDILMFSAIPPVWRVPFISTVGMVWVIYISLKRGSSDGNVKG